MKRDRGIDSRSIDVLAAARAGAALAGRIPITAMRRLAAGLAAVPDTEAAWEAEASRIAATGSDPETWLHLQAHAEVPLQCQRCLQPMQQPLAVDRRFRFVRSEAEAQALDEEIEEDVLVLEPRLELQELVEDELILALPIVPRHDVCPQPLVLAEPSPAPGASVEPASTNPFAALAVLRGDAGKGGGAAGGGGPQGDG